MKNFFIHKNGWDDNRTSLPDFIRFSQYDQNYGTGLIDVDSHKGTMGNEYWDFSIDCRQEALVNTNEDPFININEFFVEQTDNPVYKHPIFKTDWLKARYHIIEIPDYGHQSMSPYFKDFIPQVWIDGKKLWQKYVGIIRQYALKKAFLLICKENTNLGNTPYNDNNTPVTTIDVRIVFKTNIETQEDDSTTLTLTSGEGEIGNDKMFGSSLLNAYTTKINGELYENFRNFSTITHSGSKLIFRQSGNNSIKDYFRQSFIRDYEYYPEKDGSDDPGFITEASDAKSVLKLDSNSDLGIELLRKHLSYDAVYMNGNNITDLSNFFTFFRKSDIFCYNADGTLNTIWWDNGELEGEKEFIPDFQSYRKFVWKNVNYFTNRFMESLLYSSKIYPVRDDNEIIFFNTDGSYQRTPSENSTYNIVMYDNGVKAHSLDFSGLTSITLSEGNEFSGSSKALSESETPFDPYLTDVQCLQNNVIEKDIFALNANRLGPELISTAVNSTELFYTDTGEKLDLLNNNSYFDHIDNLTKTNTENFDSNIILTNNERLLTLEKNLISYILESKNSASELVKTLSSDTVSLDVDTDVFLINATNQTSLTGRDSTLFNILSESGELLYNEVCNIHTVKDSNNNEYRIIPVYTENNFINYTVSTPSTLTENVYVIGSDKGWSDIDDADVPQLPELTEEKVVYFKPPKEWIEDDGTVYIYIWKESGDNDRPSVTWPGYTMSYDSSSKMYYFKYRSFYNAVIFNNGEGNLQTGDMIFDEENSAFVYGKGWYSYDEALSEEATNTIHEIYVKVSNNWDNVYAYAWKGDKLAFGSWPGERMQLHEQTSSYKIYKTSALNITEYPNIIFSSNKGQTADISISNNIDTLCFVVNNYEYETGKFNGYWNPIENTVDPISTYSLRSPRKVERRGINKVYVRTPLNITYLYAVLGETDNEEIKTQMKLLSFEEDTEWNLFEFEYDFDKFTNITFTTEVNPHIELGYTADIYYIDGRVEEVA